MAEPILTLLGARVRTALDDAFGADVAVPEPLVLPSRNPEHGDYSISAAMALVKALKQPPLVVAQRLADALDVADVCQEPQVVAPGFVNLRLRPEWLSARVAELVGDERVGVEPAAKPRTVVVDYSAPNVAKEMHVGHLRSTIIGDCLANVAEFAGNRVERVNHVGDWGTQFGMLILQREEEGGGHDLLALYRRANERFNTDEAFAERARARVVDLQSGERTARAVWGELVEQSRRDNGVVYELLGVHGLEERGESFYQPMLEEVVADLEHQGLAVVDDGALCVFVEGFTNKDGDPLPLIVRKSDGGFNYATSDLAAVRHRVAEVGADLILYVVDAGQSQHLAQVFAVARAAGWVPGGVEIRHVPFGLVLGTDGKRLRTRSGENVRLLDLLEEAVQRARDFLVARAEERGDPVPDDAGGIARAVGIGAVKYADLSQNRTSNYVFSFDKMLSLKGNTAPYLQYAYVRMRSILREAPAVPGAPVVLTEPAELDVARRLAELGDVLERVAEEDAPNHLCAHLYELAQSYNSFYEQCPVLRADEPARSSRLALCSVTAAAIERGLALLGIGVVQRI